MPILIFRLVANFAHHPLYGLCLSPLNLFNSKEEGLVTLEGGEGEKGILIINLSMQEIEPQSPEQRSVKTEMV